MFCAVCPNRLPPSKCTFVLHFKIFVMLKHLRTSIKLLLLFFALITCFTAYSQPYAYVTNYVSNNVSVINTVTNQVIATIGVGDGPWGLAVTPDGSKVYVTNYLQGNNVSVINTATTQVVTTIPVGASPHGIAVTPDGSKVYVANLVFRRCFSYQYRY